MGVKLSNNFFIELDKQALGSNNVKKTALNLATSNFNKVKNKTIEEFEDHPISREIASGPDGPQSKYLIGPSDGNLFSFIGFNADDNPIEDIINYLQESIKLVKNPIIDSKNNLIKFKVKYPTLTDSGTTSAAPMPSGTSKNWLYAIEKGISGINNYIYKRGKTIRPSRSGPGIQAKTAGKLQRVRSGARFRNSSYFSSVINKFVKSLEERND